MSDRGLDCQCLICCVENRKLVCVYTRTARDAGGRKTDNEGKRKRNDIDIHIDRVLVQTELQMHMRHGGARGQYIT